MAMRREVFTALGGFDEAFAVNLNDVDLCLRARAAGYEVIVETGVVMRHAECSTRPPGTHFEERQLFFQRWSGVLEKADPYYSPHLARDREDLSLA